ncbi:MAG TPA: hypothetical protein VMF13_19695 [Luteitalea sp.]|nr:hypothetical protein [Luteitalea sp.]
MIHRVAPGHSLPGRVVGAGLFVAMALCASAPSALAQAPAPAAAPAARALAPKDTTPYKSPVYNVAFAYPRKDWVAVPAAGGNIALLMNTKGEASLALDFQVLRVALAPDEIDDTFKEIELEALAQRAPHARVASSALTELGGNKVVVVKYGASGLTGDLDVTQYSVVSGAALYRLTCAATRATAVKHAPACETVARTLVVGK